MFEIKNYIIFTSDDFYVIKINNIFIPSLLSLDILRQFAHVTIDMNAIKFICNRCKYYETWHSQLYKICKR